MAPAVPHLKLMEQPPDALERLYTAHNDRVLRAAYRVCGNMTDAEDQIGAKLFQERGNILRKGEIAAPAGKFSGANTMKFHWQRQRRLPAHRAKLK